ncbi:MAG: hypothetical protein D6702_10685 [Planctomycetota bacterium]|nr:MAG: hypothetical protein D6702_10685 [Planctomycetota bacterium]
MRSGFSWFLRAAGVVALALLALPRLQSIESETPAFRLLHRARVADLALPAEWFGLRELELRAQPYWDPDGSYVIPTEKVGEDILVASQAELVQALLQLEPAAPGEPLRPPQGSALVLHWQRDSGVWEIQNAEWLRGGAAATGACLVGKETVPDVDPVTGRRPARSEQPPAVKRWMAGRERIDPHGHASGTAVIDGPGLVEIHGNGGLIFAASGNLDDGPSGAPGWLNVAVDSFGDLYFWFD